VEDEELCLVVYVAAAGMHLCKITRTLYGSCSGNLFTIQQKKPIAKSLKSSSEKLKHLP